MSTSNLISAPEAIELLGADDVKFVDATWYLPNMPVNAYEVFSDEHIPGAVHFDIDQVSDQSDDLPHMYPSLERFEQCVGDMGISESHRVVVYDRSKYVASARVWWMFRSFGHADIQVLNGGLAVWKAHGGALDDEVRKNQSVCYTGQFNADSIVLYDEMLDIVSSGSASVLDARSAGRFNATEPEPRPGLRGGHIPGSVNLYYGEVMDDAGILKGADEINSLLDSHDVKSETPIVTTCGSGVTAAILLLAMSQVRESHMRLYDGSWTQWALKSESPV